MWVAIAGAVLLMGGAQALAELITEGQWYGSLGHYQVFQTRLVAQAALGLAGAVLALLIVGGSGRLAARQSTGRPPGGPRLAAVGEQEENPLATLLASVQATTMADVAALLAAFVTGLTASGWWEDALLYLNGGNFGWQDPVWGLDASFYVFDLPLILHLQSMIGVLIAVSAIVSLGIYVARGVIRLQLVQQEGQVVANGIVVPPEVRRHVGSLAAALFAVLAIGTYLSRYTLLYADVGLFTGPGYADLNGTLPLLTVQAIATAIAAFVIFVGIDRANVGTAVLGLVLVVVSAGATSLYPGLLQQFSVQPNELSREAAQIVDHVEATRHAFDLDDVEERSLTGQDSLSRADIDANEGTIANIRLWDHEPLLETFSQVQEIRTYYGFKSVDNDRYVVDGQLRQIMLSPRELTVSALPRQARTWVNETMTYTHGYGLALGPVNRVNEQGLPELWVQDMPPKVQYENTFDIQQPEIYFGEVTTNEVVVNTDNPEFDYPVGDKNEYSQYAGKDGVPMGMLNRFLFALRLGDFNFLFSGDIHAESKILLHRQVRTRARKVAPFALLDQDPYLVVDEGRLVWVVDAYTVTRRFPYSKQLGVGGNYLRNSVKITIDAYDGTTTVWLADESDPIVKAWSSIFPGLLRPLEQMSDSLRAHLRYPIDQFSVQAQLFATFHMQGHQIFYNREDEWEIPQIRNESMNPYYTVMRLPGEDQEEFIIMLPFSPRGKANLAAWMVARADGEHLGELRVYKFPKDTLVYGPKMVVARINQNDEISEKISLWDQQGSGVILGTLLVIPIEESLIYVQPLYLQAAEDSIPELKRVIVAYEDDIAMTPTLEEGLDELFGDSDDAPASEGDDDAPAEGEAAAPPPAPAAIDGTVKERILEAARRYDAATEASQSGDWSRYGEELKALGEILDSLQDASDQGAE